ncbi:hypothetical protein HDU79_008861 [Rhizoclosmatium sp. JEL0117]|nr:hypothetical protein HDU79_008861 [Rhizoclosmatium sp. JEL0117]
MNRFVSKGTVVGEEEVLDPNQDNTPVAPYVPPDNRTLYERLQINKLKKEEEFAEKTKLANLIKKLDPDEIEFLQAAEQQKRSRMMENDESVRAELSAFRSQAQAAAEGSVDPKEEEEQRRAAAAKAFAFSATATTTKKKRNLGGLEGLVVVSKKQKGGVVGESDPGSAGEATVSSKSVEKAGKGEGKAVDSKEKHGQNQPGKVEAKAPANPLGLVSGYGSESDDSD